MTVTSTSLPGLLVARADATPLQVASRSLTSGFWHEVGWADALRHTAQVAQQLRDLGVTAGTVVAVATSARWEWPLTVWAVQALGAATVNVDTSGDLAELRAVGATHRCSAWVVEDEEQFDRVVDAEISDTVIVVIDDRGLELGRHGHERLLDPDRTEGADAAVSAYRELVAAIDPDLPAAVTPTDATQTEGSVAVWSHRRLAGLVGTTDDLGPGLVAGDEYLSFLPPSWPAEQHAVLVEAVAGGAVVSFGDRTGGVLSDLFEIQPTVLQAPPTFWDSLAADVEARMADAGRLAASRYRALIGGGGGRLARVMVSRPLLTKLGLRRARLTITTGPIGQATQDFFAVFGLHLDPAGHAAGQGGVVDETRHVSDEPDGADPAREEQPTP